MLGGVQDWEDLVEKHPPLTDDQIKLFKRPETTVYDVFPDKRFHIDFQRGWGTFAYNKAAKSEVIRSFKDAVEQKWY